MLVSVTALALGLAISLPLAVAARNRPLARGVLLGLASLVQTIPSLALLALFYPLLLALSALTLGGSATASRLSASCRPCWRSTLYSMLPILRNTITGLNGVDPARWSRRPTASA